MTTLKALVNRHNIRATAKWVNSNPNMVDMPAGSTHWRVTLRRDRKQLTVPFSMGPAHCSVPTALQVLECLLLEASGVEQSFEAWASDLGYDPDSRKAERIYKLCLQTRKKLVRFLNGHFDAFMGAEQ